MTKKTADIICRSLIAIVAAIREEYDLPTYHGVTIEIRDSVSGAAYEEPTSTQLASPSSPLSS